jgi:hypothetical protein
MYLWSGLLLFDNLCVLWWYAHSTREQVEMMRRAQADAELERFTQNKPVVLTEVGPDGRYVMRNVGAGPALNVYGVSPKQPHPGVLGGLGIGQERELTGWLQNDAHNRALPAWSHVLVAEGTRTRTRRWNPTLNAGLADGSLVAHDLFDHGPDSRM